MQKVSHLRLARIAIASLAIAAGVLVSGCRKEIEPRHPNAGVKVLDLSTMQARAATDGQPEEQPERLVVPRDAGTAAHVAGTGWLDGIDKAKSEYAALEMVLAKTPEELRTFVDRDLPNASMLTSSEDAYGRVFSFRGLMKQLEPRRDSTELPGDLSELWTGFILNPKAPVQPYRILFAGTASAKSAIVGRYVVVTGVFIDIFEYEDKAGRQHRAPVLVTRDIRKLE